MSQTLQIDKVRHGFLKNQADREGISLAEKVRKMVDKELFDPKGGILIALDDVPVEASAFRDEDHATGIYLNFGGVTFKIKSRETCKKIAAITKVFYDSWPSV